MKRSRKSLELKSKLLVIILIAFAFLGSFSSHKLRAPKRNYSDFHCFYTAGKRFLNQQNIYIARDKEAAEFRYAPIFAVLMSGLALTDIDKADTLWFMINFFLLIISFVMLKKLIIPEKLDFKTGLILYLLTILIIIRFIFHNFDTGQSNILMLSSILLGLYFISKEMEGVGGIILAFSIMIKYTPLIFIPYFLFRRKIKLGLIILGSVIIYLLLPALFVGFKTNFLYLKNLFSFLTQSTIFDQMTILDPKNQSLFSMIQRAFSRCILYFHAPPMPFEKLNLSARTVNSIFIALSLLLYLAALINPHTNWQNRLRYSPIGVGVKKKRADENIDYALLLICVVLFNLNAWMHNYILLSLGYFIIIYQLLRTKFRDIFVLSLWLLSLILNFITLLGKPLGYKLHFYSPFTLSALIIFLALLKIKILAKMRY